jgi:hypothetical protein
MKIFNKIEKKVNWLQLITVFIIGILIASNGFLLWNTIALQKEIAKLKSDDMAIAQAVNSILSQIKPADQK